MMTDQDRKLKKQPKLEEKNAQFATTMNTPKLEISQNFPRINGMKSAIIAKVDARD